MGLWEGSPSIIPHSPWKIPESFPGPGAAGSWPDLGGTSPQPPGLSEGCLLPDQSQGCVLPPHCDSELAAGTWVGWHTGAARQDPRAGTRLILRASQAWGRELWEPFLGPSATPGSGRASAGAPCHAPVGVGLGTQWVHPGTLHTPGRGAVAKPSEGRLRKITFKEASSSSVWVMWP